MSHILIVDDSAVDRRLIEGLIRAEPDWKQWPIDHAEHGGAALARIRQKPPQLIISDLIMPEMDGLQFLSQIKQQNPEIPVVIVTGRGSEWMAVKALRRGAASYVPKAKLAEALSDVIRQVLEAVECDRSYKRLLDGMLCTTYDFEIESDPLLISPMVKLFQQVSHALGLCDPMSRNQLGVALDEALINAVYHGNLELPHVLLPETRVALRRGTIPEIVRQRLEEAPFRDRRVRVKAELSRVEATFSIADEGSGIRAECIPSPDDASRLTDEGGRGLVLIQNFMDEVSVAGNGNELVMVKRCDNGVPCHE